MPFQPVIDGHWLPMAPVDAVANGSAARVPLLAGTNADEWNMFRLMSPGDLDRPALLDRLDRIAGNGHEFHDAYASPRPDASPADLWSAVLTDYAFRLPAVRLLEAHAANASPGVGAFEYLFTWPTPAFGGLMGSCHALEIPFVFDTLGRAGAEMFLGGPAGPELHTLAVRMQEAWLAFARTGDPSTDALGPWPVFDASARRVMRFDVECDVLVDPGRAELDCWTGVR